MANLSRLNFSTEGRPWEFNPANDNVTESQCNQLNYLDAFGTFVDVDINQPELANYLANLKRPDLWVKEAAKDCGYSLAEIQFILSAWGNYRQLPATLTIEFYRRRARHLDLVE